MMAQMKASLIAGCLALTLMLSACDQGPSVVGSLSADALLSAPPANALILDVRTTDEFASGHVPGAINIPYDEVGMRVEELGSDRDRTAPDAAPAPVAATRLRHDPETDETPAFA